MVFRMCIIFFARTSTLTCVPILSTPLVASERMTQSSPLTSTRTLKKVCLIYCFSFHDFQTILIGFPATTFPFMRREQPLRYKLQASRPRCALQQTSRTSKTVSYRVEPLYPRVSKFQGSRCWHVFLRPWGRMKTEVWVVADNISTYLVFICLAKILPTIKIKSYFKSY